MARQPRQECEGGIFHVFARGNRRESIYLDDLDRRTYLRMLGEEVGRRGWLCLGFCLMNNHVHLLLETPQTNLGRGMQRFHGLYAQGFNERHGRPGHLFQGRYGAVRVTGDEQLWTTARYIALNPVTGGLCERPERWAWSSHRAILGGLRPPWLHVPRLLSYFESAGGDPRRRYERLILDGLPEPLDCHDGRP